jgi:hypothetical protein
MPRFKFKLLGLIEIVSTRELPTPFVYALSIVLVAMAIKIVLWSL